MRTPAQKQTKVGDPGCGNLQEVRDLLAVAPVPASPRLVQGVDHHSERALERPHGLDQIAWFAAWSIESGGDRTEYLARSPAGRVDGQVDRAFGHVSGQHHRGVGNVGPDGTVRERDLPGPRPMTCPFPGPR